MSSLKVHYKQIDSLKGFCIFLVVLGHAIIYFPINLHENIYCEILFKILSSVHMPLFFTISGYCFSYRGNYREFILKKVKRLVIPYFVFNLLDIFPRAMLQQFVNRPQSISDSIKDILLYGGEYWFLYTLFVIFLIYPIIYKFQTKSLVRQIVAGIALLVIAVIKKPTNIFTLSSVSYYLVFFNLGALLKVNKVNVFELNISKLRVLLLAGLAILWISLLFSPWEKQLELIVSLTGIIVCYCLTKLNAFNNCFERFGKFSLQIYLLNGFLLVISRTIICQITDMPIMIILFNMFVDFLLSYFAIKYICNRFSFIRAVMGMD